MSAINATVRFSLAALLVSSSLWRISFTGRPRKPQASIAAMVGARGICPFLSRATEAGIDMLKIISDIKACYKEMDHAPEIFAVSLKSVADVNAAFAAGTDSIALRYPLLQQMMTHVLTEKAEALFAKNWANVKGEDVSYMGGNVKLDGVAE